MDRSWSINIGSRRVTDCILKGVAIRTWWALHRELADYVIVHELLHLYVPNHGKLWKSLMRANGPADARVRRCVPASGGEAGE
jgi:predicted metal-dependent hydrolase